MEEEYVMPQTNFVVFGQVNIWNKLIKQEYYAFQKLFN